MPANSPIQDFRQVYAELVTRKAGAKDRRLVEAFACTQREQFVGPGPWAIFVGGDYISTPSDDPRFLYRDVAVALDRDRGINNGQPSLHARCLSACAIKPGETFLHIGAGTGYYSAIAASMVGKAGHLVAFEIDPVLASQASSCLEQVANLTVYAKSGCAGALPTADIVYVSAGSTHPVVSWLDALNIGGRLAFPLTPDQGFGVMLVIVRVGTESYSVSVLMAVAFIPCIGARDSEASKAISASLQSRAIMSTKSLLRGTAPDSSATLVGSGWWLSSNPPNGSDG